MLCRSIISELSLLEKKTVPCDVTGAGENDRATFAKSTSDRSNGSITSTVKLIATDMFENSGTRDINQELRQKST